jgi:four helix bundle protein
MERPSGAARSFRELIVWQKAHRFVLDVYRVTECFPRREMFGLTSQLRRAAVSVAANISEGFKKRGLRHKARFLNVAQGSVEEARYYLILVGDLNYADTAELQTSLEAIARLLGAYTRAVEARSGSKSPVS